MPDEENIIPEDDLENQEDQLIEGTSREEGPSKSSFGFLSSVLIIILLLGAIFSFSLIAIELGEIKRMAGLKESTELEIKKGNERISAINAEISDLKQAAKSAEQNASKYKNEEMEYRRVYKMWKEAYEKVKQAEEKAETASKLAQKQEAWSLEKKQRLDEAIRTEEDKLANLKSRQSSLETEIQDLQEAKVKLGNVQRQLDIAKSNYQAALALKKIEESLKAQLGAEKSRLQADKDALSAERGTLVKQVAQLEQQKTSAINSATDAKGEASGAVESKIKADTAYQRLIEDYGRLNSSIKSLTAQRNKLLQEIGALKAQRNQVPAPNN